MRLWASRRKGEAVSSSPVRIELSDLLTLRQRIGGAPLLPQQLAGQDGGLRSRFRGRGMEFAEVRPYQAGDDVRAIDWRVTARRQKVHTKLFHEEREQPVLLAIDYRRPMFFATRGCFKAVQVSRLAALLAWQALGRGDRVGAFLFSEEQHRELRPRSGKGGVLQLLRALVDDPVWERPPHRPFVPQQRLAETLQRLHRVARPGSRVLILSDFIGWDDEVEKGLTLLGRHCDLGLWHCFDPFEASLPPTGDYRLSDGERDLSLQVANSEAAQDYLQNFAEHTVRLQRFARGRGRRYCALQTDDDPVALLYGQMQGGAR
ncbi:MAG: DUF58 domain-containing protein [Desulfuromonas sp.]|nr:MAG: DUF58 domain-containing protein [Desulfuromonas sp.]